MAQIIQGPGTFGGGLASGLGVGLNNLLQSKLDQLSQRNKINQTAQGLQAINPNLTPEMAKQLAPLPESYINQYLKNIESQRQDQQQTQLFNYLSSLSNQVPQPNVSAFGEEQQPVAMGQQPLGMQAPQRPQQAFQIPQGLNLGGQKALPLINTLETIKNNQIKQSNEQQKLRMKADEIQYKRLQDQQDNNQKKFGERINKITNGFDPAKKGLNLAVNQLELLNSGKIPTGPIGAIGRGVAGLIENPELSQYVRDTNQYVVNKFGEAKGIKSKAFLQKLEDAKIKAGDPMKAQLQFWEKEAESNKKEIDSYRANQDVLEANDNMIPKDWDKQIERQEKLYARLPTDITPASEFPEGTIREENGVLIVATDGRWKPIGLAKGR